MARWVKHINSSFTPLRDVINHVCASMGNGSSALPPHPKAAMVQVANGACAAQPVCSPMQRHPTHSFVGRALASGMHHMCSCPKAVGPWVGMPPQLLHAFGKNGMGAEKHTPWARPATATAITPPRPPICRCFPPPPLLSPQPLSLAPPHLLLLRHPFCCRRRHRFCCRRRPRRCRCRCCHCMRLLLRLLHRRPQLCCCCCAMHARQQRGSGGIKQGGSPGRPGSAVWFGQPCKCKGPTIVVVSPAAVAVAALLTADGGRRGNGGGGAGEERGSRNKMHPAQKNCAGLRPGQCPVCVVRGRGEAENSRTAGGERREEQTEMRLFRESVFL